MDEREYWLEKQRYAGFDPATAERLRIDDAAKLRRDADMLEQHARAMRLEAIRHRGSVSDEYSDARAVLASGEQDWSIAPREKAESDRLAKAYGITPRLTNSSYFCGRTLVASGSGSVSTSVQMPTGVPPPSNSFLALCDVQMPTTRFGDAAIGRWDSLPSATVQASETTEISPSAPTASISAAAPVNVGVILEESKMWALQSPHGAASTIELASNAVRVKVQQQIVEGSNANGELKGFLNDSAVPNAAGTTLAASHIVTAMESVEAAPAARRSRGSRQLRARRSGRGHGTRTVRPDGGWKRRLSGHRGRRRTERT
jgi:hypothetical protein